MVGLRLENTHLKYNGRKLTLNDDGDPESLTVTPDVNTQADYGGQDAR